MAFQVLSSGGFYIPRKPGGTPTLQTMLIDAANEEAAGVFRAGKTGTIDKIGFLTGTVTTGATVDVRLETVSLTDGDPTGTLLGTDSNGSQIIADADDNTWFLVTLTTGVAVTKGDLFAMTIVNPSVSFGNMDIRRIRYDQDIFGYSDLFTGTWAKSNEEPCFAFEYSDGSYAAVAGAFPVDSVGKVNFNSSSTPDERGLKFKFPFPVRVTGAWVEVDLDENADVVLYDSDDSVLETISLDKDVRQGTAEGRIHILFSGTQELTKDVSRRLVLKPTTTTNIDLREFTIDAVAVMDSFDGGQDFHHTSRTDGGSWTDTTTRRPLMGLILDAFDDGVGGAPGHGNLTGGMQ